MRDIIDATEGPHEPLRMRLADESCCHKSGQCKTRRVWEYVSGRINQILQSITLRDMLEQERFDLPDQGAAKRVRTAMTDRISIWTTPPPPPYRRKCSRPCSPISAKSMAIPASIHSVGRDARRAVEQARRQVAAALGAQPTRDLLHRRRQRERQLGHHAARPTAQARKGNHIITTPDRASRRAAHLPAAGKARALKSPICRWTSTAWCSLEDVEKAIRPDTILDLHHGRQQRNRHHRAHRARSAKSPMTQGVLFHTDAVQAVGAVPIDVKATGTWTCSASPATSSTRPRASARSTSARACRSPTLIMYGGAQERGQRAGTENLAGIVGLGNGHRAGRCGACLDDNAALTAPARPADRRHSGRISPRYASTATARSACPATSTSPSATSRARRCCCAWIWRASPASSGSACTSGSARSLAMCCWPSACRTRSPTAACACRSGQRQHRGRSGLRASGAARHRQGPARDERPVRRSSIQP